jgi:hypothetical protein
MKTIGTIFLSLLVIILFSCKNKPAEDKSKMQLVTKRIFYMVDIKNAADEKDSVNNIPTKKREAFLKTVFDNVMSGKVSVYTDDAFNKKTTPDEINASQIKTDTIILKSQKDPEKDSTIVLKKTLDYKDVNKLGFTEEWLIDPMTLKMEKKIKGFAPIVAKYIIDPETGEEILKGYQSLFWVKCE